MLRQYRLLEESRKSWQYVTSDEAVHLLAFFEVSENPFLAVAKDFMEGRMWIEAHFTLRLGGYMKDEAHWTATYECDMRSKRFRKIREVNMALISVNRDAPMFVNRAQGMETPKKIVAGGCHVPTVIRLKRLDDRRCLCGYSVRVSRKGSPVVAVIHVKNREIGVLGIGDRKFGKRPNQMIQSSASAVQEVSEDERHPRGNTPNSDANEIASLLQITFGPRGNGFRVSESSKFTLQAIKVFLRPGHFGLGISYR